MPVRPDRIRERLLALNKNPESGGQSWLAREVGMKPQGIQSIMAGGSKRPRLLREIAVVLRTTEEYLLGETDNPAPVQAVGRPSTKAADDLWKLFKLAAEAPEPMQMQVISAIEPILKGRR